MSLQEEIDATRRQLRTDSYSMSIGEWISLYQNNEINIHTDLHWSDHRKSYLIESILVGIPIPPILVSQENNGAWNVIDGVQRLSTIYQFVGILKSETQVRDNPPFTLQGTFYLPSLKGKKWHDPNDPDNSLSQPQRLLIKRAKIAVNILDGTHSKRIKLYWSS